MTGSLPTQQGRRRDLGLSVIPDALITDAAELGDVARGPAHGSPDFAEDLLFVAVRVEAHDQPRIGMA